MRQVRMGLVLLAAVLAGISGVCAILILVHAFGRSVGTGVMVLLIPFYMTVYAFTQFEHRWKGLIATTWLASLLLSATISAVGLQLSVGVPTPRT
jgi:translocator protein